MQIVQMQITNADALMRQTEVSASSVQIVQIEPLAQLCFTGVRAWKVNSAEGRHLHCFALLHYLTD